MLFEIHAIVEHAPISTLPSSRVRYSRNGRATNASDGPRHGYGCSKGYVRQRSHLGRVWLPGVRIIGYIADANEERFVSQSALQAEMLMGPSENRLDIALGNRRNHITRHGISRQPCDARPVRLPGCRSGL